MANSSSRPFKGKSIVGFPSDFVVFDTETTGLDPVNCKIIEFGAIKVHNDKEVDSLQILVDPCHPLDPFISSLTGITDEMLYGCMAINEALPIFLDFVGKDMLIGHNVNFDINFVYESCMRLYGTPFSNNFIDTMKLSRKLFPQYKHHRLSDLGSRFSIPNNGAHRALSDARQTYECFEYMKNYVNTNNIVLK